MIDQINPPFLKSIESQGYVFSHILKCSMNSKFRTDNAYQYMNKIITEYDITNLYPKDDKIPEVFKQIDKWVFPSGIRPLKQGDDKYTKVSQVLDQKDTSNAASIQDINYFAMRDPSNNKMYRCVSGIFYEKISTKGPKEKKYTQYLVPVSYCVISENLYYHPMKQFVSFLIMLKINPSAYIAQLKEQDSIFIDQILEDENKLEDFLIQSVFHCSEIKGHNHKFNINLTSDTSHPFIYYYNKNDINQPFLNLICPSNISFEHLIFNQSPNNLFYLVICMLMEYQIVITSSKSSTSTLFCENLIMLIRPLTWKGLYYPTHLNSGFNYQNCTQPFLIGVQKKSEDGLERFQKQPNNRIIYDLDENNFIFKPDDIPIPLSYKNYLIKNLNFIIADLRFWEEQTMTIESEMKYKQFFYNFFLLTFHDILNYFQKGSPPSMNSLKPSNQQSKASEDVKSKDKQAAAAKNTKNAPETESEKQNLISLGYAYFNQEDYIKSFGAQDQAFFQKVSSTKVIK